MNQCKCQEQKWLTNYLQYLHKQKETKIIQYKQYESTKMFGLENEQTHTE